LCVSISHTNQKHDYQYDKSDVDEEGDDDVYDDMMIHEYIQLMFSEESDDDDDDDGFVGFEYILPILVHLICGFNSGDVGGVYWSLSRCVLYESVTYTRIYMVDILQLIGLEHSSYQKSFTNPFVCRFSILNRNAKNNTKYSPSQLLQIVKWDEG